MTLFNLISVSIRELSYNNYYISFTCNPYASAIPSVKIVLNELFYKAYAEAINSMQIIKFNNIFT